MIVAWIKIRKMKSNELNEVYHTQYYKEYIPKGLSFYEFHPPFFSYFVNNFVSKIRIRNISLMVMDGISFFFSSILIELWLGWYAKLDEIKEKNRYKIYILYLILYNTQNILSDYLNKNNQVYVIMKCYNRRNINAHQR